MASQAELDQAVVDAAAVIEGQLSGTISTEINVNDPPEVTLPADTLSDDDQQSDDQQSDDDAEAIDGLSDDEIVEAQNLYKLLKNPSTARGVAAALAEQTGLLNEYRQNPNPTRAETKDTKKAILDIFKESLGKEYDFLADRLSTAVEKTLAQERESNESRQLEIESQLIQQQIDVELATLNRETKGNSKALENRMAELAKEIPVGDMAHKTYIRRLYAVAASERGISSKVPAQGKSKTDKIRSNANDPTTRLSTSQSERRAAPIEVPNKKMKAGEAVDWALQQLTKK